VEGDRFEDPARVHTYCSVRIVLELLEESGADSLPLPQLGLQVHCHAQ
jgi:hypothetical protein